MSNNVMHYVQNEGDVRLKATEAVHSIGVTGFTIRNTTTCIDARYLGNFQWNVQFHTPGNVEIFNTDSRSLEKGIMKNFVANEKGLEVFVYR